jgi:hypothetical protein
MKKTIFTFFLALLSTALFAQTETFDWVRMLDGNNDAKYVYSINIDISGNICSTGQFQGTLDLDPGSNSYNITAAGGYDIYISKLNTNGDFVWGKRLGSSNQETSYSIITDLRKNVYVTGIFSGTCDFDPGSGNFNLTSVGQDDIFIIKLDSNGNFRWARRIGGADIDIGYSIACDDSGNVYTTGYFFGPVDFDPGTGVYNLSASSIDDFILKLDSVGNFVWAKKMGGPFDCKGYSITIDELQNVLSTGTFAGAVDFDPGPSVYNLSPSTLGTNDIFISKISSSGNFIWAKKFSGSSDKYSSSIKTDALGNVYTSGEFQGTVDFNPGSGVANLASAGQTDIFISKLNPSGGYIWCRGIGSTGYDNSNCLVLDSWNNVYTCGNFEGTVDFNPSADTFNITVAGETDVYISKSDSNGNFIWAKSLGGISWDISRAIDLDVNENIYTAGIFYGTTDFDPDSTVFNLTSLTQIGIFIQKMRKCTPDTAVMQNGATLSSEIPGAAYQWIDCDNGNSPISGATGQSFTASSNGHYAVIIIQGSCRDTSSCFSITTVGMSENQKVGIEIFPEPTTGIFYFKIHGLNPETQAMINISDIFGKEILTYKQLLMDGRQVKMDISNCAKGIYFIRIQFGENLITRKIVLQ